MSITLNAHEIKIVRKESVTDSRISYNIQLEKPRYYTGGFLSKKGLLDREESK
jgi:hypothetical protein